MEFGENVRVLGEQRGDIKKAVLVATTPHSMCLGPPLWERSDGTFS